MAKSIEKRLSKFLWSGENETNNPHLVKRNWIKKKLVVGDRKYCSQKYSTIVYMIVAL